MRRVYVLLPIELDSVAVIGEALYRRGSLSLSRQDGDPRQRRLVGKADDFEELPSERNRQQEKDWVRLS